MDDAGVDDDGRIRTGSLWSGTAHAFTAIVGTGILALPWSMAQLGWILGPFIMVTFAIINYFASILLSDCYRTHDPIFGRRNYTYTDAVRSILGRKSVIVLGIMQYIILWGAMIGYTITTAMSIATVKKSSCFHKKGENARCEVSGTLYIIVIGAVEIILSQFPNLEKITFLSVIATVTSFIYEIIALSLSTTRLFSHPGFKGTIMVAKAGAPNTPSLTKIWHAFQALGNIAFAYNYSIVLLEIQDTLKSPPSENKVMKRASLYAISAAAVFYISLGCVAYAAFGNDAPGNILTGFRDLFWLVDVGNLAVIIHLIGAYQVFAQTIFAKHEKWVRSRWPTSFLNQEYTVKLSCFNNSTVQLTLASVLLRTGFVILTTMVALIFPFFNAILGLMGSICFWPLTVYFPITMYIVQMKIKRGTSTWMMFQAVGFGCLIVTIIAAIGSVAEMLVLLKHAKLFHIKL